jgi:uroporphyrin-III C-methyltransferase/precorrin-2 dehydrogenase/sirohydrochlorin ferrochelatase
VGERENDWAASVLAADTAVIYMGTGLAEAILATLIARGKPKNTPLALVESASLPGRRILHGTLADLPELARRAGSGPTVVLLGEVLKAALAEPAAAIKEIEAFLKRA